MKDEWIGARELREKCPFQEFHDLPTLVEIQELAGLSQSANAHFWGIKDGRDCCNLPTHTFGNPSPNRIFGDLPTHTFLK